mmetsp:Transcript_132533/g.264490  ORF Transcript_132533/g.264490 Transcript_132533/m.264490 type:complete len:259 (-) Transcript_132533:720-1496(-)
MWKAVKCQPVMQSFPWFHREKKATAMQHRLVNCSSAIVQPTALVSRSPGTQVSGNRCVMGRARRWHPLCKFLCRSIAKPRNWLSCSRFALSAILCRTPTMTAQKLAAGDTTGSWEKARWESCIVPRTRLGNSDLMSPSRCRKWHLAQRRAQKCAMLTSFTARHSGQYRDYTTQHGHNTIPPMLAFLYNILRITQAFGQTEALASMKNVLFLKLRASAGIGLSPRPHYHTYPMWRWTLCRARLCTMRWAGVKSQLKVHF